MDRNSFKLRLHRTEVLRRPISSTISVVPLRKKYMAYNYTLEGVETRGIDKGDATPDPDVQVHGDLVPPNAPADEPVADQVVINPDVFTYEEAHKVLKDGRVVQKDPVPGKWSRRPVGVEKEIWDRLPHLHKHLQRVGPKLFTDEELWGWVRALLCQKLTLSRRASTTTMD